MSTQNQEITTLVRLSEHVFGSEYSYSLMANLRNLRDEDWDKVPSGGGRSITDILEHVGEAKRMYQDYTFGEGTLPPPPDNPQPRPREELLDWLKEAHQAWITSVGALTNDAELDRDRLLPWGETLPIRNIIRIVLAHDVYHAGEINHIRALLQKNDHWT